MPNNRKDILSKMKFAVKFSRETSEVISLLDQGVDIEIRDRSGQTPLHWAAGDNLNKETPRKEKTLEVINLLLDRDADLEARDEDGNTPLHLAAADSTPEVVALLLDRDANIEALNEDGETPLHRAADCSDITEISEASTKIELLLDRGANGNVQDVDGNTPFDSAENGWVLRDTKAYSLLKQAKECQPDMTAHTNTIANLPNNAEDLRAEFDIAKVGNETAEAKQEAAIAKHDEVIAKSKRLANEVNANVSEIERLGDKFRNLIAEGNRFIDEAREAQVAFDTAGTKSMAALAETERLIAVNEAERIGEEAKRLNAKMHNLQAKNERFAAENDRLEAESENLKDEIHRYTRECTKHFNKMMRIQSKALDLGILVLEQHDKESKISFINSPDH